MCYVLFVNIFLISLASVKGPTEEAEMTSDQKLALLLDEFLKLLSDNDKKKRKILTTSYSRFSPPNATSCYFNAYGAFMTHCISYFYEVASTRKFKYLFHRACEATWLTEENIVLTVRRTCETKPYLRPRHRPYKFRTTTEEAEAAEDDDAKETEAEGTMSRSS